MIDEALKVTIKTLRERGNAIRGIARKLGLSKNTVRKVLDGRHTGKSEPAGRGLEHVDLIRELFGRCKGNVVRVHQVLADEYHISLSYPTLTALVRNCRIRPPRKKQSGTYDLGPGDEMQHDTTACRVLLAEQWVRLQCAGLVLAYSRTGYVQFYPRFTRFEALVFLTRAFGYAGGTCARCTIDNTSVLVADGAGPDALIAEKVRHFGAHYGTTFIPHAVGHCDRKPHIEKLLGYVQTNFLAGRRFADLCDLNRQAVAWCDQTANGTVKRALAMSPAQALLVERPFLTPLPEHVPDIYHSQYRVVDLYGDVHLETNRYSVPYGLIGKKVEVQKHMQTVKVYAGRSLVAEHPRVLIGRNRRVSNPAHRSPGLTRRQPAAPLKEESLLVGKNPTLDAYVAALKKTPRARRRLKHLLELERTYPQQPFIQAVQRALRFGLFDIHRLETLIISLAAGKLFNL